MRPILIDTNAYTAFMRGDPQIIEVMSRAETLYLNTVVLGELLAGFAAGSKESKNRSELALLIDSPRVAVLPITANTADSYALIYAGLRRKGQPIPSNDLWIAASALEHGAALLTFDAHFSHVAGVRSGKSIDDFVP